MNIFSNRESSEIVDILSVHVLCNQLIFIIRLLQVARAVKENHVCILRTSIRDEDIHNSHVESFISLLLVEQMTKLFSSAIDKNTKGMSSFFSSLVNPRMCARARERKKFRVLTFVNCTYLDCFVVDVLLSLLSSTVAASISLG